MADIINVDFGKDKQFYTQLLQVLNAPTHDINIAILREVVQKTAIMTRDHVIKTIEEHLEKLED